MDDKLIDRWRWCQNISKHFIVQNTSEMLSKKYLKPSTFSLPTTLIGTSPIISVNLYIDTYISQDFTHNLPYLNFK